MATKYVTIKCSSCGKKFKKKESVMLYQTRRYGQTNFYCSIKCSDWGRRVENRKK